MSLIEEIYDLILRARREIAPFIKETPLDKSRTFSVMTGANVYLKLENLQKTGSFKVRGATFKIMNLTEEEKKKGVIAASAGNHAQGVAYAASALGVRAVIVMPEFAPMAKIEATRSYGAEVILYGRTFDACLKKALEMAETEGLVFIHPYDDPYVIAGQGTIGLEIMEKLDKINFIVVPIGGGGLISGISIAVKKKRPNVKIVGVQTEAYHPYYDMLKGKAESKKAPFTIADGIAVKSVGRLTSQIISELVDDIVIVSDDEISRAIFLLLERAKILVEGAGAASVAALLSGKVEGIEGKNVVAIVSGGNMDLSLLAKIIMRELIREGKLVRLRGILPDLPGSLVTLLEKLAEVRANVVDIFHNRFSTAIPAGFAQVEIIAEVHDISSLKVVLEELRRKGYFVEIEEGT